MAYEDPKYLEYVRRAGCCASGLGFPTATPCTGPIEPHHYMPGGTSTKCSDLFTVPLCNKHHGEFHNRSGNGWAKHLQRFEARDLFHATAAPLLEHWLEAKETF